MNFTEAFALANRHVGVLYSMGRGQAAYNTWSERHRAWWQGNSQPTAQARESRCRALVQATLVALGWDGFDAMCAAHDDRWRGDFRSRVRQIIKSTN
jgi:hypothetical protein